MCSVPCTTKVLILGVVSAIVTIRMVTTMSRQTAPPATPPTMAATSGAGDLLGISVTTKTQDQS